MEFQRYYWVREINQHGIVTGTWQPAWLDTDGNWNPRSIPGWIPDAEFRKMFEIFPTPMQSPENNAAGIWVFTFSNFVPCDCAAVANSAAAWLLKWWQMKN